MKKILIIIFLTLTLPLFASEWDYTDNNLKYKVKEWKTGEVFILQISPSHFDIKLSYDKERIYIDEIEKSDAIFAINAGYFFTDENNNGIPIGILKADNKIIGTMNSRYPFFYVMDNNAGITNSSSWIMRRKDRFDMLLQSGPVLVWDGRKRHNFNQKISERSAVGITPDNHIIFCITRNTYLSLDELANILSLYNCQRAVNLDGSGSSQAFFKSGEFEWISNGYYKIPAYIYVQVKLK